MRFSAFNRVYRRGGGGIRGKEVSHNINIILTLLEGNTEKYFARNKKVLPEFDEGNTLC